MRQLFILAIALIGITSCSESQENPKGTEGGHQIVSAAEFTEIMDANDYVVLDVRTPEEYAGGTIGSAKNVDWFGANFESEVKKIDKNKPVMVFCAMGGRSGKASRRMIELGFTHVIDLKGGYNGYPKQ